MEKRDRGNFKGDEKHTASPMSNHRQNLSGLVVVLVFVKRVLTIIIIMVPKLLMGYLFYFLKRIVDLDFNFNLLLIKFTFSIHWYFIYIYIYIGHWYFICVYNLHYFLLFPKSKLIVNVRIRRWFASYLV